MAYDLVIRGGTVVDGSGLPRYRADVGIRGDRIARIGTIHARGREEVDARHQVVAPGLSTATPTWTRRWRGIRSGRARAGTG
jgi:N-acyl-D-aspartate/D-glutamate deacylase